MGEFWSVWGLLERLGVLGRLEEFPSVCEFESFGTLERFLARESVWER